MQFYVCSCYYTDNIFLSLYKLHVRFITEQQFKTQYQRVLDSLGCTTEAQYQSVLEDVRAEVERRRSHAALSAQRKAMVRDTYRPLHLHVYRLQESFLAPEFVAVARYCGTEGATQRGLLDLIASEAAPRVFRFPVFTGEFCRDLLEELEHFEESRAPKGRPNTMNNHGILLDELGLDEGLLVPLRERYLSPVASLLYPDCGGRSLDSHKAFAVKYQLTGDRELGYHYDNAEVTLNAALGRDFTDGNLYFGDMREVPLSEAECSEVQHRVTQAVLHRGQHMHGALPISSGRRWNLIVWMRSSRQRNRLCPMCRRPPRLQPADGHGDGFTREEGDAHCALA